MATNVVLINGVLPVSTSIQTLYTSPTENDGGSGTRIVAFTATNTDGSAQTYDLHIVPLDGTADNTNKIGDTISLTANQTKIPLGVINQLIPPGGTIQIAVSVGSTINFRATGIEF
jgi:hypothetical protein